MEVTGKYRPNCNLPAVEFIKSGYASGATVLLLRGERAPAIDDTTVFVDDERTRAIENATRLALLLTRSFVKTIVGLPTGRNISSIRLKDFYINFDLNSTIKNGTNSAIIRGERSITLRSVGIISQDQQQQQSSQNHHQESLSTANKTMQNKILILGKILYSIFCNGRSLPENIVETISLQSSQGETILISSQDTFSPQATNKILSQSQANTTTLSDDDILDLFGIDNDDDDDDDDERSTRRLRITERTLFRTLIDEKNAKGSALPKSICRLLADMLDEKSVTKITYFDDIMLDLEQMISQPLVYLHDSCSPTPLTRLQFGQKCYSREKEVSTLMKLAINIMDPTPPQLIGAQAIFVSGIAGSGKSRLVQSVADNLSSLSGWIVIKAKFERSKHASRRILSSMFNGILTHLVKLKDSSSAADNVFSYSVSQNIMDFIGLDTLSGLVDFLPGLLLLFCDISKAGNKKHAEETTSWQLSLALSTIIGEVLNFGRFIMICCDDLQWADAASFSLISDVLMEVSSKTQFAHRCLFVGMHRMDEIDEQHPLSIVYPCLQMSDHVNINEGIELSNLSKRDIQEMLMDELQLPRRLISELAEVVYKKTMGHALFVVEFLNSLLRDSVVTYSSENCRFAWDDDRIVIIETGKNVAEFIASNLKSLEPESLRLLQILSCFGVQTEISLLQLMEKFHEGIMYSIENFVEKGILDQAGPLVIFTHDLVHEAVYGSMPLDERKELHMRIGKFLGLENDAPLVIESVTKNFGQLHLKDQTIFSGRNLTSTLVSLTCDQVNAAGPDNMSDHSQREQSARWNLSAGQFFAGQSDFSAALYYFTNGIAFLDQDCWSNVHLLCVELHQGAALSSFALGMIEDVDRYAQKVIENVAFEDSLDAQVVVLRSLIISERHEVCISQGIAILRRLKFELPLVVSPQSVGHAMASVATLASWYPSDHIANLCKDNGIKRDSKYAAIRIADTVIAPALTAHSPFLPLISCEVIKFTFQNGCCPEAAVSFAVFAFFQTFLGDDYLGGKHWADLARIIIKCTPKKDKNAEIRTELFLHITIDTFFESPMDVASKLLNLYHAAEKIGLVDCAVHSLVHVLRYRLFGGHNLPLIVKSYEDYLELIAKKDDFSAKYTALDATLAMELMGLTIDCSSVFGYPVASLDDIRSESECFKDKRFVSNFHLYKMMICFWDGKLIEAEVQFQRTFTCPSIKTPRYLAIIHSFFGGLVVLGLHRQTGGNNNQLLKQGRNAMEKIEKWSKVSMDLFDNKLFLLQAEYSGSIGEHDRAQMMYISSIKAAKDHGRTHDLALAYELWGNYCLTNNIEHSDGESSDESLRKAHMYYEQWGATTLARKLVRKYKLRLHIGARSVLLQEGTPSHTRKRNCTM